MTESRGDHFFIIAFRLLMAWTFLYAASDQVMNPKFSITPLLRNTKTFHDIFAAFAGPDLAPVITILVAWGHFLIGLSLLAGFLLRVSVPFGIALMLVYWLAQMDWPYVTNRTNFIIDFHVVYAVVLGYLLVKKAGHVWGFDGWAAKLPLVESNPTLKALVA